MTNPVDSKEKVGESVKKNGEKKNELEKTEKQSDKKED
jgi:hypothetical protein